MKIVVSAIFDHHAQAEQALSHLRAQGIPDQAISIVAQDSTDLTIGSSEVKAVDGHENKAGEVTKGALAGAGIGALFGLIALAIPGAGPFITAGALAEALGVTGGAVVTGAIVGGTAGGLSALLIDYGVKSEDAAFYEQRLHEGGVFIAVDVSETPQTESAVRGILHAAGGRSPAYLA